MIGPYSVARSPGVAGRGGGIWGGEGLEAHCGYSFVHGSRCSKTASGLLNRRALSSQSDGLSNISLNFPTTQMLLFPVDSTGLRGCQVMWPSSGRALGSKRLLPMDAFLSS